MSAYSTWPRPPAPGSWWAGSDAVTVYDDAPTDHVLAVARKHGFTRLPVVRRSDQQFVGVVNLFDLVAGAPAAGGKAADCMREIQLIAGEARVGEALTRMRGTRQPMMLVTGADRAVIGLITLEDVLACIVGEF